MGVQFGKVNLDGKPVDPKELDRVQPILAPCGPDGESQICKDNFAILHRSFYTTKESRLERQPYVFKSGEILTWNGRLDNRQELINQIGIEVSSTSTDLSIVSAAYERWGIDSFAKLIGDWALSSWNPRSRVLLLAKDFVGTRPLYYSVQNDEVSWCSTLDALVLFAEHPFEVDEEYMAGWLSFFPGAHLTPYRGIHSVPPSSFVYISPSGRRISKYWDFDPGKRISYRTDAEYEEHFRSVFSEAIRRRLRSDFPVLAELSGGIDSSSIVCVADTIMGDGHAETPQLDTISYYNDSEPNWNERPYFTAVEQKRGCAGDHIDVSSHHIVPFDLDPSRFAATPGSGHIKSDAGEQFNDCLAVHKSRSVLSGIGGDEVTGGVPTPTPELQDLLAGAHFGSLAHQLKAWALQRRQPWFHLLLEAVRAFLSTSITGIPKQKVIAPWLRPGFIRRNRVALRGYKHRVRLTGSLPSFQSNLECLELLRRQLGCSPMPSNPHYEWQYPYLDRNLLEFLFAVPREQLVRPGQRRSLVRRALVNIVPDAILNRKRKAFVSRQATTMISLEWPTIVGLSNEMVLSSFGIVEPSSVLEYLNRARTGHEVPTVLLLRALAAEVWLRQVDVRGLLFATNGDPSTAPVCVSSKVFSAEKN